MNSTNQNGINHNGLDHHSHLTDVISDAQWPWEEKGTLFDWLSLKESEPFPKKSGKKGSNPLGNKRHLFRGAAAPSRRASGWAPAAAPPPAPRPAPSARSPSAAGGRGAGTGGLGRGPRRGARFCSSFLFFSVFRFFPKDLVVSFIFYFFALFPKEMGEVSKFFRD